LAVAARCRTIGAFNSNSPNTRPEGILMSHKINHSAPGAGTRLNTVDSFATVKIGALDTDDQYELFEVEAPQGPGVPPHRHPWAEAYYVLDGTMDVRVGARVNSLEPGASITVPPNAVHAIEATSPVVRFLAFSQTPGTGRLFRDLDHTIPAGEPDEATIALIVEVANRNDVTFLGPSPQENHSSSTGPGPAGRCSHEGCVQSR
jgi:quercetin dioxygenase-like cupin family protein